MLHPLLRRQLRHHLGEAAASPDDLAPLLTAVSGAYAEADRDRAQHAQSIPVLSA